MSTATLNKIKSFSVHSNILLPALNLASSLIIGSSIIPVLECFLFIIKEGILTVRGADMQSDVITSVKIDSCNEEFTIAVEAKLLLDTIKSIPNQPLVFNWNEQDGVVELISSQGHFQIPTQDAETYPKRPTIIVGNTVVFDSNRLYEALEATLFASCDDKMMPHLQGLYIDFSNNELAFVTCDAKRLAKYTIPEQKAESVDGVLLGAKTMKILQRILPSNSEVKMTNNSTHALFEFGDTSYIIRSSEERFPNYKFIIPNGSDFILKINRMELINSLKRIALYSNTVNNSVTFEITQSYYLDSPVYKLKITAECVDFKRKAEAVLDCELDEPLTEPFIISFPGSQIVDSLSHLQGADIVFGFTNPTSGVLITPLTQPDEAEVKQMIMPLKVA